MILNIQQIIPLLKKGTLIEWIYSPFGGKIVCVFLDFNSVPNGNFSGNFFILNWKNLYKKIKTLKIRYRVSLAEALPPASVFRLSSLKSLVKVFEFS